MIAPLKSETWKSSQRVEPRVRRARRLLVELLWSDDSSTPRIPPIPTWQAWVITAWIFVVAVGYLVAMLRSLS